MTWVAITALLARSDTDYVKSHISVLKSELEHGNEAAAQQTVAEMEKHAAAAHARTSGPAWWFTARIPYLGMPLKTTRGGTSLVDRLATTALPSVVQAGAALDPSKLRPGNDTIDLTQLGLAADPLRKAAVATQQVRASAAHLPTNTWLGPVNSGRASLVSDLNQLSRDLDDLATTVPVLSDTLGGSGTKRYFMAFETEAESRGLGGLPGAYAILTAKDGRLSFTRFGADSDLNGAKSNVDLGGDYNALYDGVYAPQSTFVNSDPSPNFPDAARIWISMWQYKYHQRLDGAIAVDPTALGYLLGAVGPVSLADGTQISSSNAVQFFENTVYLRFAKNDAARKAYQVQASQAVASSVIGEQSGDLLKTAAAMRRSADERRLLVYVRNPSIERTVSHGAVGGAVAVTDKPFLAVVLNNNEATKIDYYLRGSVTYSRATCTANTATVTVRLTNTVPTSALHGEIIDEGVPYAPKVPGREALNVALYGTDQSAVGRVTANGKSQFVGTGFERGHPVTTVSIKVDPDKTTKIVYQIVLEPIASGPVLIERQPLVSPLRYSIDAPTCS